jgi:hypothetical protein
VTKNLSSAFKAQLKKKIFFEYGKEYEKQRHCFQPAIFRVAFPVPCFLFPVPSESFFDNF